MTTKPVRRRVVIVKAHRTIRHLTSRRLEIFATVGIICFVTGWILHSDSFKHFAEFTGVPVLEAFLSRGEE